MNHKKVKSSLKTTPLWVKIVGVIVLIIFLGIAGLFGYFALWNYNNTQAEKVIDQKFHQEVAQVPELRVKNFMLWEGDSMITVEVENKGEVRFWYGKDGVPRIDNLGQYSTSYTCFYVDVNGKKTGYAYDTGLVLDKEGKYVRWFPFQVNNLKDLVEKYDAVTTILATFPKNSETIPFEDNMGKRDAIKESNPKYLLKQQFRGKEVWCDLHQ